MFAQAFLARDRTAFLRGYDFPSQLFDLFRSCAQLRCYRIIVRQFRGARIQRETHTIYSLGAERHVTKKIVDFHCQIELCFPIFRRIVGTRIADDLQRHRVDVLVFGQFDGVGARQDARADCGAKRRAGGRRHFGCIQAHRPDDAIKTAALAAGNRADQFARRI